MKPGKTVFLMPQESLCPIWALQNLAWIVPTGPDDPLFSWCDRQGDIHPIVRGTAIGFINTALMSQGWGMTFGHSFHIGRASFFLSPKVDPKIVCLAGCWCSLAYKAYIRAFKQIASCHLSGMAVTHLRAQHEYKYLRRYLWVYPWENLYKQITCAQVPSA